MNAPNPALEPWQWPEEEWRRRVDRVRAGRKLRPAEWPGGARCAVALSFDSDHETSDLRDGGNSIGRLAWGQYGNRVGRAAHFEGAGEIPGQGELLRARGDRPAASRRTAPGRRRGS